MVGLVRFMALAVFAGWRLPASFLAVELKLGTANSERLRFLLRWVVPALIAGASIAPLL